MKVQSTLKLSVNLTELKKLPTYKAQSGDEFVTFNVKVFDEESQYGDLGFAFLRSRVGEDYVDKKIGKVSDYWKKKAPQEQKGGNVPPKDNGGLPF